MLGNLKNRALLEQHRLQNEGRDVASVDRDRLDPSPEMDQSVTCKIVRVHGFDINVSHGELKWPHHVGARFSNGFSKSSFCGKLPTSSTAKSLCSKIREATLDTRGVSSRAHPTHDPNTGSALPACSERDNTNLESALSHESFKPASN